MTQVNFHFVLTNGDPVSNTKFQVTLPEGAYQSSGGGVYLPTKIMGETDNEGKAVLELEPLVKFPYTVVISDWDTGASIKHTFIVPDSTEPQNLIDLVAMGTDEGDYDFKQETIDLINKAKADTRRFSEESEAAKDLSVGASSQAGLHKEAAERAETNAANRAIEAGEYRDSINSTSTAMTLLKSDMDGVASAVSQDRVAVNGMKTDIDNQFLEVNSIIQNELDPRLAQATQNAATVAEHKTYIDGQITTINTSINDVNLDFDWVSAQRDYIEVRINYFETKVDDLNSQIGSVDTEVQYIQEQRTYFDNTLLPEINGLKTDIEGTAGDVTGIRDDLFLLSTNGGGIFTKSWPAIDNMQDLTVDVSQETTHFFSIGQGGDARFTFTGWHATATKYIVLVISNGGRGVVRWPATTLWQSRDNVAPVLKENGIDTIIMWCNPAHATAAGGAIIFAARVGR